MIYIVMGMHKSGTSMMARILHRSGIEMGECSFIKPDHVNREGYFENHEFTQMNEELLRNNGAFWDNPKVIDRPSEKVEALVHKYRQDNWGWKDPRTAWTLPSYLPFIGDFVLIFMRRNKQAVIASMERTHRSQSGADFGRLYDIYWKRNNELIARYPSITFDYDAIIDNINPKLRHNA